MCMGRGGQFSKCKIPVKPPVKVTPDYRIILYSQNDRGTHHTGRLILFPQLRTQKCTKKKKKRKDSERRKEDGSDLR